MPSKPAAKSQKASSKNEQQPIIELQNINRDFGRGAAKVQALRQVDLKINSGEFVAIMGRSGSGKSTLMNIIGLLDRKFSGSYQLSGLRVSGLSEDQTAQIRSQKIGFVFQQFNLLKRTSVLQNVLLPTTYAPSNDDQLRAIKLIESVGLGDKINTPSNQLSGGQMQRVAIARALMMDPEIILADEPTGNLDSATAQEVMKLFKDINKRGKTIILVTHEDDIAGYADRKISMLDGQIKSQNSKQNQLKKGRK